MQEIVLPNVNDLVTSL